MPDPGSEFFHPGYWIQGQTDSGSRIRFPIKEFKYFLTQKIVFELSEILRCSSRIRILIVEPSRISAPGSRGQKGTGSRIRNTARIPSFKDIIVIFTYMYIPSITSVSVILYCLL
jgi:hypothetical protein